MVPAIWLWSQIPHVLWFLCSNLSSISPLTSSAPCWGMQLSSRFLSNTYEDWESQEHHVPWPLAQTPPSAKAGWWLPGVLYDRLLHAIPRKIGHWVLMFSGFPKSTGCSSPFQTLILKNKEKIRSLTLTSPSYFSDSPHSTNGGNRLFFYCHTCLLPYSSLMMGECIS